MPDSPPLGPAHAEALVRVIETAHQVRRRYHFFMWTQGAMQLLLPHQLAVCGAYHRERKEMVFEVFHSVAVPAPVLATLTSANSALMRAAEAAWIAGRGRSLVFEPERHAVRRGLADTGSAAVLAAGYARLLLHGVARPQRRNELETLFLLASPHRAATEHELLYFDLLLPHLHSAYLRFQATERELTPAPASARSRGPAAPSAVVSAREKEVLRWVRDGKNNQQIGAALGISPLTVKNHVQKILRKLGAANRAQAVAMAIALDLLAGSAIRDDTSRDD